MATLTGREGLVSIGVRTPRSLAPLQVIPTPPGLKENYFAKHIKNYFRLVILGLFAFKDKTLQFILKNDTASFHPPAPGHQ